MTTGMTTRRPSSAAGVAYVPVYTLHEMMLALRERGEPETAPMPVVICSGCGHPIPAPRGSAGIQCRDCGKRMQVVSISPATQASRAL